jgi:WD40 repeat protein
VFLRQRGRGKKKPDAPTRYRKDTIVTASDDEIARVWEATTGRSLATLQGHTDPVTSAAFSPDGKWVVTASDDKIARVWEAATGRSLATLQGHTGTVTSAAFSPDGKWVVTAGADKTARVYPYEMFAPAEEVIERAQQRVLRALTPFEQTKFDIEEQSPATERQNSAPRP